MEIADGVDFGIAEAIEEAVRAGVFRAAARLNPKSAPTWDRLAEPHTDRAATLLDGVMRRLGVEDAGPFARGEWF